jgi:dTDP-4-amino-4,6-dideoxygalactose transaminase
VTDDDDLYERAFAMHDQGHAPDRLESKYAPRPFLGMNFRMTELSGAVLGAQVRKLDQITSHLRANKAIVKDMLEEVPVIGFLRELTDPEGDLATHLVVVLPTKTMADAVVEDGRVEDPRRIRLAHVQPDEPPTRAADDQRQGLSVSTAVTRTTRTALSGRHAAPEPTTCSSVR